MEAVERLMASPASDDADDPRPDWLTFAGGTIRPDMIAAVLRSRELVAWLAGRDSAARRTDSKACS
jgi:hypothetical protein